MKLVAFKEKEEIDGWPQHVRTVRKKASVDKENAHYLANAVRLLALEFPRVRTVKNACPLAEVPTESHAKCISRLVQAPTSKRTEVNVTKHL